jgi:hypothetical protein
MSLDFDVVIVAIVALAVLLLVAGAEGMWRRRAKRRLADEHRSTSGSELVTAVIRQAQRPPAGRHWAGAQGLEDAQGLPRNPEAGLERSIIKIVAVYRTYPVMIVGETAQGSLLEHSLPELADVRERMPPRLWHELVEQYHVFQIR